MADLGDMIAKLMLDASSWIDGLKKAEAETQAETAKMEGSFGKVGETLASVAETVAAWKITEKLVEFAGEALDVANAVNQLKASFDILAGSAEASEQIFEDMQALELKSKFDFADVLGPAAQRMLELGVNAKQTGETMTALVDAASALRKGPEWINAVTETIAGMQSRLVASARDMKAFESEGIDAWGALAEKIGTDVPTAIEQVKKGMVTAQTVTEAVTGEMKKQFEGAATLTGTTWNGAMAILRNSADNAKEAIGQGLLKVLNDFHPVLNTLSALIQDFAKWWEGLSTPVQTVIIAFTAALPIIVAISEALPLLTAGLAAVAGALAGPVIPIAALVAALALFGKWVYDEWPAIKNVFIALWDDIVKIWQSVWSGIAQWLDSNFGGIAKLIGKTWTDLKSIVSDTIDWIVKKFDQFTGLIGGWISGLEKWAMAIPGVNKVVTDLTQAWTQGQIAIARNKAEIELHSAAIKTNAQATQAAINTRKQQDQVDTAAANAAKAAAEEKKKADAEAKKAAEEAKKYNEDLLKGYNALNAIAPDVAKQFSEMFGGIETDSINAAKVIGKPWADLTDAQKQLITQTLQLGAAYQALGATNLQALGGVIEKQIAAFETLKASGQANSGVLTQAFDAVVASMQKIQNASDTDLKEAFDRGLINATAYYQGIVANAQKAYDAAVAAGDGSEKSSDKIAAAWQVLQDAVKAAGKVYDDAMASIGEKTPKQLDQAIAKTTEYADTIRDKLGIDSRQYLEASVKQTQALLDKAEALGNATDIEKFKQRIKDLNDEIQRTHTPAEQFAADMKTLGVNTMEKAVEGLQKMGQALADAKRNSDGSLQAQRDLKLGTDALTKSAQDYTDKLNGPVRQALQDGKISQVEYLKAAYDNAVQTLQAFTNLGDKVPGKMELVSAAMHNVSTAMMNLRTGEVAATEKAFSDLGLTAPSAVARMREQIDKDLETIAQVAGEQSEAYQLAWGTRQQQLYDMMVKDGTSLSSAQKEDLGKIQAHRDEWFESNKSAWGTAYGSIKTTVGGVFDDLTKQIVTGDLSFGKLMTNLWQGIAEAALNAFINPLKTAITNFISHELADLLGDKGLGGVLGGLKNIGSSIADVFSGAGKTAYETTSAAGGLSTTIGAGGEAAGAATSGAGAASTAASTTLSSITGIVGAVGGVVSAISGVIGNFQSAKQETTLNAIEHNTRYSMMYVGERADGGILGQLFRMGADISYGSGVKAAEEARDILRGFADSAIVDLDDMKGHLWTLSDISAGIGELVGKTASIESAVVNGIAPYMGSIKGALEDIRSETVNTANAVREVNVSVQATGVTTQEAARMLGDQIAVNLTRQMVPVTA